MSKWSRFLTRTDENYNKAKSGLRKVKEKFDGFIIDFPDITPSEIMFIKDKWEVLPKTIASGVKIMALNFDETVKTLLVEYSPNSYIAPHKHITEYEIGNVIKGSLINKLSGEIFNKGDIYRILPNEVHYFSSKNGCIVHSLLTTYSTDEIKPLTNKLIKTLKIT